MSTFLRIIRAAHLLQRVLELVLFMLARLLPSRLVSRASSSSSSSSSRMVSTRRQRQQQEGMAHVLERLRGLPTQQHAPLSAKLAAVLVALFEGDDGVVRVWLTQRAAHLNSHQGEVCLPGGKRDASDPDDGFTAKREAWEEMGLAQDDVQVIRHMAPMLSLHLLSVTPVVAQVPSGFVPTPNPDEVQAVFSMPLSCFLDAQRHLHWDVRSKRDSSKMYRVHSFDWQGQIVWGLTASILIEVAAAALGRRPDFEVAHPSNAGAGTAGEGGGGGAGSSANQSRM